MSEQPASAIDQPTSSPPVRRMSRVQRLFWWLGLSAILLISGGVGFLCRGVMRPPVVCITCQPWPKSNEWGFRRSIGLIDEVNHEAIEIACWGSPNRDDQPRRVELTAYSLTTGSQKYTVKPELTGSFTEARRLGDSLILGTHLTSLAAPIAARVNLKSGKVEWKLNEILGISRVEVVKLSLTGNYLFCVGDRDDSCWWLIDAETGTLIKKQKILNGQSEPRVDWFDQDRWLLVTTTKEDGGINAQVIDPKTGEAASGNSEATFPSRQRYSDTSRYGLHWVAQEKLLVPTVTLMTTSNQTIAGVRQFVEYRSVKFAELSFTPSDGLKVSPSTQLQTFYDVSPSCSARLCRQTNSGDWLEVRKGNPWLSQLAGIDRFLAPIGLSETFADWTQVLRADNLLIIERRRQLTDSEPVARARFTDETFYQLMWSDQQNYVGGIEGDCFKQHRLVVYATQPLMPAWLWQMLLTVGVFGTFVSLRLLLSLVRKRWSRRPARLTLS